MNIFVYLTLQAIIITVAGYMGFLYTKNKYYHYIKDTKVCKKCGYEKMYICNCTDDEE